MPGSIHCTCGKRLRVGAEAAGKQVRCPFCDRTLRVPAKAAAAPSSRKGPVPQPPSQLRKRKPQEESPQSVEQVPSPRQGDAEEGAPAMTRGAIIALAMGLCLSLALLFWVLKWCGAPAPRWVILTTWGSLAVLFWLVPVKDRSAATKEDADTKQEEGRESPVEAAPEPPPDQSSSFPTVLSLLLSNTAAPPARPAGSWFSLPTPSPAARGTSARSAAPSCGRRE
jgi:hypothetical protein